MLRGETINPALSAERAPILIHPDARRALRDLLWESDMRGVGYSEFILRAVAAARAEREQG